MSLTVTADQIDQARQGRVSQPEFLRIIETSLPFAYAATVRLADRVRGGEKVAIEAPLHMADSDRNQLLRAFASTSMRQAFERHFRVRLAFQNCHHIGATTRFGWWRPQWRRFVSARSQILAQRPELRDC